MGCLLGKKVVCANKNPTALLIYDLFIYIGAQFCLPAFCLKRERDQLSHALTGIVLLCAGIGSVSE